MSSIRSGAIDCDVHVEPPAMDALLRYIEPYWHEFIRGGRLGVGHRLYPESEPMSARPEARAAGSFLYNSQIIAPNQVLSLVAEGVFDRHPDLRVGLAELGFAWLPSLLWRFDKDWKALWRETPWVRDKPSVYVRKHLRATTSPTLIPGRVPAGELAQLAEMLDAGHMLMYSSDYPHDHGNDALENLLGVLTEDDRAAVLSANAAAFFDLQVPAVS